MATKLSQRRKNLRTRARMKDRKRRIKNKKRKYIIYYIFFAIIILSTAITLSLTTFFKIEKIIINNSSEEISYQEILNAINLDYYDNLIRFDSKKAINKLLKTWPTLSFAEIVKKFPNAIEISCEFDAPAFFIETADQNLIGVAKSGRAIRFYENWKGKVNKTVLKFQSSSFNPPKLGEFLTLPKKEQQNLHNIINCLARNNLTEINKIEINEKLETCLTYDHRLKIKIKNISKIENTMPAICEIVKNYIGQNEKGELCYFDDDKNFHFIPTHSYF